MPKHKKLLKVRIPPYSYPRNAWRKLINKIVAEKAEKAGIKFAKNDKLEVQVKLYMEKALLKANDVDNRLKDILDAIQGRAGGSKTIHKLKAVVPNDNQIYRASIEKMAPSPQSHGLGHLIIKLYKKEK